MMTALCNNHLHLEALELFDSMSSSQTLSPDPYSFTLAMTACAKVVSSFSSSTSSLEENEKKDVYLRKGRSIHFQIPKTMYNTTLLNTFLHFYGEAGNLREIKIIWSILSKNKDRNKGCDVVSYNTMMNALINLGQPFAALSLYVRFFFLPFSI